MRRAVAARSVLAALAVAAAGSSGAKELTDQEVLAILATERPRDRAIEKGLEFLRGQQVRGEEGKGDDGALSRGGPRTALTSLGVLAHLAAGRTFADPECGRFLRRCLAFVLRMQDESGYFGRHDDSRMYGHGITTLMLAEALGMIQEGELEEASRRALEKAVAVTVNAARVQKSAENRGGWRYHPTDGGSDLSLSGWQLMSLHAAQQIGVTVPEEVIRGAVEYARRLSDLEGRVGYERPGDDHPALRGLGMLCMAIGRAEGDPLVDAIARRIQKDPIEWRGPWFFYRVYYDAVGLSRARPELWEQYSSRVEDVLVKNQKADGSWPSPPGDNESGYGPVYVTSMAVLALAVDRHVLPAYQR